MTFSLNAIRLSGFEVLPIIEGGKGISISSGQSSGAFAAANSVGTFSGVNAQRYYPDGSVKPIEYFGKTRLERHEELVKMAIEGGIAQARIAHEISGGRGPLHMNILWEMGGAQRVLEGILDGARGLIHAVTCGAGMPYKLSEIAAKYRVYYYPIVSSMRAFRALWHRSYSKVRELLGGVVYEDPWKAGGHNGLSNAEDPQCPQDPYPRVLAIRQFMNEVELDLVPIVMAGGVWNLTEWQHWINNKELGSIAFQFGTRPILTQESPVPDTWKHKLLTLKEGDVFLNKFSPTGFYSSAVRNNFIEELRGRSERQVRYAAERENVLTSELQTGQRGNAVYVSAESLSLVEAWKRDGYTQAMKTPDSTLVFVSPKEFESIRRDQINCMGCLSACKFSNWMDKEPHTTGLKPDPRSFCIQKTLQNIVSTGDVENNLMFSGHNAFRFGTDPFYANGFVPTVRQLVDRIALGL